MHTGRVPEPGAPDPLLDPPSWAPAWLPTVDDARGLRILRWVVYAVLFAGLAACMSRGADSPADPVLGPEPSPTVGTSAASATTGPGTSQPVAVERLAATFGTAIAHLVTASGDAIELCVLEADTPQERGQGLMQVTDLGGYDGMVFANDAPSDSPFYMYRTLLPLTVAWWGDDGAFVSATDMSPCDSTDPNACERYPPGGPYRLALEVEQGSPLVAAFEPGASLRVTGGACPAPS